MNARKYFSLFLAAAALITLLVLCLLFVCVRHWAISNKEVYFTERIEDYNSRKYPVVPEVFLDDIPSNADVVSFSFYSYWNEAKDICLELKFSSKDEMEAYLSELKAHGLQSSKTDAELFVTKQNPYDTTFTDLFCTTYLTCTEDQSFTGYSIDPTKSRDAVTFACNFGVVSFSYEKLTVIQSYACGSFRQNIHDYTPRYFLRFALPLDEKHDRLIYF